MAMSIKMRNFELFKNKNYSFFSKTERQLKTDDEFFAHIIGFEVIAIQIRNTSTKSYIVSKNFKLKHLKNYDEKNCFMTASENSYLTVTSIEIVNIRNRFDSSKKKSETILSNEITIYGDAPTVKKINTVIEKISDV